MRVKVVDVNGAKAVLEARVYDIVVGVAKDVRACYVFTPSGKIRRTLGAHSAFSPSEPAVGHYRFFVNRPPAQVIEEIRNIFSDREFSVESDLPGVE